MCCSFHIGGEKVNFHDCIIELLHKTTGKSSLSHVLYTVLHYIKDAKSVFIWDGEGVNIQCPYSCPWLLRSGGQSED